MHGADAEAVARIGADSTAAANVEHELGAAGGSSAALKVHGYAVSLRHVKGGLASILL